MATRRTAARLAAIAAVCALAALVLGDRDGSSAASGSSPPPATAAAPGAQQLAERISANDTALRQAIDVWKAGGGPPTTQAPSDVITLARNLQEDVRFLAKHANLARQAIAALPGGLGPQVRELVGAARKLRKLSGGDRRKLKTGLPPTLDELTGHYDEANRIHGIGQSYLAAIHLVETKFGRVKSKSTAGARGPMQFIPSTWKIYGGGGNINDPHDAIIAAARLLRDNGAPGNYAKALYAYNNSQLYVNAVQRYARQIAADPYALLVFYCWGP